MFDWSRIAPNVRAFTNEGLRRVAFPLGGIGTGTVSLGGRGELRDWEVFNRPAKGRHLPYTFFALWAKPEGADPTARVLERRILPPYDGGFGLPTGLVSGLPRLREAVFTGAYPLARIAFEDAALPITATLEAWNPFIPMNDLDSGTPTAVFVWRLTNPTATPVDASLCFSLLNACGLDGTMAPGNRHASQLGMNLNEWRASDRLRGITMSSAKYPADHLQFGTMALTTPWPDVTWATRWERAGWWDDVQSFWDDFASDGILPNGPSPEPSPDGQSDVGSVAARVRLAPGESIEIPFILAWHFPNMRNYWNDEDAVKGATLGNWYAAQWPDAWSAAEYVAANMDRLAAETQSFCNAYFDSTLPLEALDAASANASIMRTTTCMRTADGRFNGFEGCGDNSGCCPMNCTHVWNYEQAVAHLFPALERTVRETDFLSNLRPSGDMAFRTLLPLKGALWAFKPAADGQMGTVMKVYREWLQCGDREFLARMWPGVRKAIEFAWSPDGWDADQDGVMEGEQHNTYDIEFHGPNTMMGTLYLGALRAGEEMAHAMGEPDTAAKYREVFEKGSAKHVDLLWSGEYFAQIVLKPGTTLDAGGIQPDSPDYPRYQYGAGCLADHMLGQWWARVVGLGDLLPADKVAKSVKSIFRRNFRSDLTEHHSVQRVYAVNDEAGLLLCTWPNGGRPAYPFPYADEVWTGIEYQVAAHLIYEGFVEEGLEVVRAVRSRHDGSNRNPWNEFECGHHYARAMSSWSVLLALSGYHYSAAEGSISFAPKVDGDPFQCFFSAGTAWGSFRREAGRARISVAWGSLTLREVTVDGRRTVLSEPVVLNAGDSVDIG